MFIIGNLLGAFATVLNLVLQFYMYLIIAQAILSWVNPDPHNPIVRFLYNVTEPVLGAIRRKVPMNFGGIDFSPMIVILIIIFLQKFVVDSLATMAMTLR